MKTDTKNPPDERRDEDQANAIGEGLAAGALPDEERREDEPPLTEEPPAEGAVGAGPESPASEPAVEEPVREPSDQEKVLVRIHDILDEVKKNCDPADRILIAELKQILEAHGVKRPEVG